jgi:ABC-2 type transport system permease protein
MKDTRPAPEDIPVEVVVRPIDLQSRVPLSALGTLFWLTLRQHARGRRVLVLALLFALPLVVAVVARSVTPPAPRRDLEFALVFTLLPHVLVPLTALLFASGMIQDEVEDQTLTYLLVRPLPRWAIYLTKLLATWLVTVALAAFFTLLTYVPIYWGDVIPARAVQAPLLTALALLAYCCVFGCMGVFASRALVAGVLYIVLFEGLLANFNFAVRRLTVMYYFRTLSERWLGLHFDPWRLDLDKAPGALTCVLILLAVSLAATWLAASAFARKEFGVKTPVGS